MHTITRTHHALLALVAALVLLAAAAGPAPAKSPPDRTGVFAGELHHESADGVAFDTDIVLTIARSKGAIRLASVAAIVRTYCPDPGVADIHLTSVGKVGPRVDSKGRFTLKRQGVVLRGRVGSKQLTGSITASVGDCTLPRLTFTARKRVF